MQRDKKATRSSQRQTDGNPTETPDNLAPESEITATDAGNNGDGRKNRAATDPTVAKRGGEMNAQVENQTAETSPAVTPTAERSFARALPDTFMDERDDVLAVIHELEDQLDRYEETREALERELAEANQQNQIARQRVQELEWQAVTLQTRVEALEQVRQEVTLLEEEIADANTRAQRLAEQLARSEKETTRLNSELKAANKQLEELWSVRKERDGLRADLKNAIARFEQLERTHRDTVEEKNSLQSRLQESQLALEETRAARKQLDMNLRNAEIRNEELHRTLEDLQQKLESLRSEKKNLQAQLAHMERENTRLAEQQQFYECELTSLRSMNRNAEAALANVKKAFAEVRVALAETKARARRRAMESIPRAAGTLRGIAGANESAGIESTTTGATRETETAAIGTIESGDGNGEL